jgi:hypothetical protein
MNAKGGSPVPYALDLVLRIFTGVIINITLRVSVI